MSDQLEQPICTIVIPAFNEAAVIARTLENLIDGARDNEFEIILVCNGCSDDTAAIAAAVCPEVHIIELQNPSKTKALNAGMQASRCHQVVFLDADIVTGPEAVRTLLHRLSWSGAYLAYGTAKFQVDACSWAVKAFYQAWQQNPYFDDRKMGGFFALSKSGRNFLGAIPETTNDDEFIRRQLSRSSTWAENATYHVEAPRTLRDLIKVRSRIYRGNAELESGVSALGKNRRKINAMSFVRRLIKQPVYWPGAVIFALTAAAAHVRNHLSRGLPIIWETDESTRTGQQSG